MKDGYLFITVSKQNNLQEFINTEIALQVLCNTHFLKE